MISKKYNEQMGNYLAKLAQAQTNICVAEKPISNADRIRSMTDEELAEYLFERGNEDEYCYGICVHQDDVYACVKAKKQDGCIQSIVAWLKQEAKE